MKRQKLKEEMKRIESQRIGEKWSKDERRETTQRRGRKGEKLQGIRGAEQRPDERAVEKERSVEASGGVEIK